MKRCDHLSVGVLIYDNAGRQLMLTRARPPAGIAPVAGHIDGHGTPRDAAIAETYEEVGLTVVQIDEVAWGHQPNLCRREPTDLSGKHGHEWTIFAASVTGDLVPAQDETKGARWYAPWELQSLADRTVRYAYDQVSEGDWQRAPGLEPVWCYWLDTLGVIRVTQRGLDAVRRIYSAPPGPVS